MNDLELKWFDYPKNKNYKVTKCGKIKSIDRKSNRSNHKLSIKGVLINPKPTKLGYIRIRISKDGISKKVFLHRVIAETFLENKHNKRCVNHKNGIKTDNRVDNLEWCTHSENTKHAIKKGMFKNIRGSKHHHSRLILNVDTGIFYEGAKQAFIYSNYSYGHFKNILSGRDKNKTSFKYV